MRLIIFFIYALIVGGSVYLSMVKQNNLIIIELLGYHIETSIVLATIIFLTFITIVFYLFYFLLFVQKIPSNLKKYYQEKQNHDDLVLLLEGYASLFKNDLALNNNLLKKIINHKTDNQLQLLKPITSLLIAESTYRQYENDKSHNAALEDALMHLLQHDTMKIIALEKLIKLRVESKRYYDALIYAEKAVALEPKLPWLIKNLIHIYSELGMYEKKDYILNKALSYKYISKDEANALFVKNYLAYANYLIANSDAERAIELIEKALKIDPACYDAISVLVELYHDNKNIYKIIEKAWKVNPSMDLAKLLYNKSKSETLNKKIKLFENLIDSNTNSKEGYLVLAEIYLEEKMYDQARKVMENLLAKTAPDFATIKLMALIEAKSHANHNVIISWLSKL